MLSVAKADSGNMQYEYRKMDVNAFIKSVADMAEMKTSPDTIVNCMFGRSELTLTTAPERLSQVMMNLLNNAVKYTASGNITVGYDVHGDEVRFYVKDTGTGIAPEKQKHVCSNASGATGTTISAQNRTSYMQGHNRASRRSYRPEICR